MVNIESYICKTVIVMDILILQDLVDKSMLDFLQSEKYGFSPLKLMVNINNVAIFINFLTYGKNQLNFVHLLIKMHPTTDQDMGNKRILFQNSHERHSTFKN